MHVGSVSLQWFRRFCNRSRQQLLATQRICVCASSNSKRSVLSFLGHYVQSFQQAQFRFSYFSAPGHNSGLNRVTQEVFVPNFFAFIRSFPRNKYELLEFVLRTFLLTYVPSNPYECYLYVCIEQLFCSLLLVATPTYYYYNIIRVLISRAHRNVR